MLASGSLANASSAASRIAWTLRSASERRRRCVLAGVVCFAISVDGHCGRVEAELGEEVSCVREDSEGGDAREASEDPGCHERVRDRRSSVGSAECSARKTLPPQADRKSVV